MPEQPDDTAAALLADAGRILFPGSETARQTALAAALGVRRETIRQWLSGHVRFDWDHGALDDLLAILTQRETELRQARQNLEERLQRGKTRNHDGEH
jgi:hypothetical protein